MAQAQPAANFDYQDFDPFFEWAEDEGSATLIVMLPGFTKEQLRVQVTSSPTVRINGERQIVENKRRRFSKEFSIPPYCDTNDVSAKFEGGVLSIKFPKLIAPVTARSQQLASTPQKEKEQPAAQPEKEPVTSTNIDEKEENKAKQDYSSVSPQKENNEPISDDKTKEEVVAEKKQVRTTSAAKETTSSTSSKPNKITQRLKTRVLDFTVSLRSVEDHQNKYCANLINYKRPKIWINIFLVILLVMVLGLYVKNAFRPSQPPQGGSEFKDF